MKFTGTFFEILRQWEAGLRGTQRTLTTLAQNTNLFRKSSLLCFA